MIWEWIGAPTISNIAKRNIENNIIQCNTHMKNSRISQLNITI